MREKSYLEYLAELYPTIGKASTEIIRMGAAAGHPACIATVIRLCLRHGYPDNLEDGCGINMLPLSWLYADERGRHPEKGMYIR